MTENVPQGQITMPLQQGGAREISPQALAVADYLRNHKLLKQRPGILNGKRSDFFRVKRAIRALEDPKYKQLQSKPNSKLPPINSRNEAISIFRLMPINQMALRVDKLPTQTALMMKQKPEQGVPVLQVNPQQEFGDDMYYTWFYNPVPLTTYLYGALGVAAIFAGVLFPLWPIFLRQGVWYLSVGMLGLIGVFFGIALVRLVIFVLTWPTVKPGIWIFPNLFADVGFVDSFIPLWAWHGTPERDLLPQKFKNKKKKKAAEAEPKVPPRKLTKEEKQKQREANAQMEQMQAAFSSQLSTFAEQMQKIKEMSDSGMDPQIIAAQLQAQYPPDKQAAIKLENEQAQAGLDKRIRELTAQLEEKTNAEKANGAEASKKIEEDADEKKEAPKRIVTLEDANEE
ncbi:Translocation protein [Yarrowia sp. B02]|nr:Translocation protein [Yarrowia sp. B02]